jgi:hypothetical protein
MPQINDNMLISSVRVQAQDAQSYDASFPSFHRAPSVILEDPCAERHKLAVGAVEGASVLRDRASSAATSSVRARRPRASPVVCDPVCDPAEAYQPEKHSPRAKWEISLSQLNFYLKTSDWRCFLYKIETIQWESVWRWNTSPREKRIQRLFLQIWQPANKILSS